MLIHCNRQKKKKISQNKSRNVCDTVCSTDHFWKLCIFYLIILLVLNTPVCCSTLVYSEYFMPVLFFGGGGVVIQVWQSRFPLHRIKKYVTRFEQQISSKSHTHTDILAMLMRIVNVAELV